MIMIRRSYLVGALLALVAFTPLAAQNGESPSRGQGLSIHALDSLLTQEDPSYFTPRTSLSPELEQRLQAAPSLGQLLLSYYRQGGLPPMNYYSPLLAQLLLPRPWASVSRTPLGLSSEPQPSAALSILAPTEEQLTCLTSSPRPFDLTIPQLSPGYALGLALRRDYLRQLELRHPEYFASSSPTSTLALARPSDLTSERLLESYTKESKLKKIDLPQQRNYGDLQERHWLPGLESSIQFSQNQVSENWYKGGASNLNVYMRNYFSLRYITERVLWNNELESKLSIYNAEKDSVHRYRIADDLLRLRSNYGLRAWNKVYYTLDAELRTQLLQSHRENRESVQSDFLAPFTINIGLGMKYDYSMKSQKVYGRAFNFTINVAPISYTYRGTRREDIELARHGLSPEEPWYQRIGSTVHSTWQWKVNMNLTWTSRLYFNTSYKNVEAEWENTLDMALTRYFSTRFNLNLRYDDAVRPYPGWHRYLQYNELLSFGFNYRL